MKLFQLFLICISLSALFSCGTKQKVKIISKYPNGNVKEIYTYGNPSDSLSYLDTRFHNNGKILYRGHLDNGKKEGAWVWYFPNGFLEDSAIYHKGDFIGRRVHWDSLGRLSELEIINGPCYDCCCDGIVIRYYTNGKTESEAYMHGGKENGKYVFYYDNGQPKKEEYFNEGAKEGKYYEWHPNGKQWVTGFYKNDNMDSIWTWFDTTGKIESIQLRKNGAIVKDIK